MVRAVQVEIMTAVAAGSDYDLFGDSESGPSSPEIPLQGTPPQSSESMHPTVPGWCYEEGLTTASSRLSRKRPYRYSVFNRENSGSGSLSDQTPRRYGGGGTSSDQTSKSRGGGSGTPTDQTPRSRGGGSGTPTDQTPRSHGGGSGTPTDQTPRSRGGGSGTPTEQTPTSRGGGSGTPTDQTPRSRGGGSGTPTDQAVGEALELQLTSQPSKK